MGMAGWVAAPFYGMFFLLSVAIGFAIAGPRRSAFQSLGKFAATAVVVASVAGTGALLATQSRGGYLGYAVGLGTIVWLTGGMSKIM